MTSTRMSRHVDAPREGSLFRISLTYDEPTGTGKTTWRLVHNKVCLESQTATLHRRSVSPGIFRELGLLALAELISIIHHTKESLHEVWNHH